MSLLLVKQDYLFDVAKYTLNVVGCLRAMRIKKTIFDQNNEVLLFVSMILH